MIFTKRTKAVFALAVMAALMLAPALRAAAAEGESWLYIDGENITRAVNAAVIYRGVSSTGQTQWGANAVLDENGKVTAFYDGGDSAGADLAVPENGAVISASGTKAQWLRDNLKVGRRAYYDSYTGRLFAFAANGDFDPYTELETDISGEEGDYRLPVPEGSEAQSVAYSAAINENGVVIARGPNVKAPEGGALVSAHDEEGMRLLRAYAPVGAECEIGEGKATFKYDKKMLSRTLETAISNAKEQAEAARAEFRDADYTAADKLIEEAEALAGTNDPDHRAVFELAGRLEKELPALLADKRIFELRGAIHVPAETNAAEVAEVVSAAARSGINKLYLRMTNGYGTFIKLPEGYAFAQSADFGGFDVLAAYAEACRRAEIGLEVCVDVYYNEYAAVAQPGWTTVSNTGEQGLANKFYSPASKEFADWFVEYMNYLVTHYDIDGVTLDWLRYPRFSETADLGYDSAALAAFAESAGISEASAATLGSETFSHPDWTKWVEFRTGLITGLLTRVSETIRGARKDVTITAVAARDSVPHYYMQDPAGWLENGLVDGVCIAFFEGDADENDGVSAFAHSNGIVTEKSPLLAAYAGNGAYFFVGLDSRAALDGAVIEREIIESRELGADGVIFSDLGSLIAQHYSESLINGLFAEKSVAPGESPAESEKTALDYVKTKINEVLTPLGGCDESTAAQAFTAINGAMSDIGESGLSPARAGELESEMAMIFSRSEAKHAVTKDFAAISKFAALSKAETEFVAPQDPDESSADPVDDSSAEESKPEDESEAEPQEASVPVQQSERGTEIGGVLAYTFVGLTFAGATAAAVAGIRRRKKKSDRTGMYSGRKTAGNAGEEDSQG